MFNIPMNTKAPMSLSDMAGNQGQAVQPMAQPVVQPAYQQPVQQNTYQQPVAQPAYQQAPVNQPMQQPVARPAGSGVFLKKGQKVAIAGSNNQPLARIRVCLGWDRLNQACDLDASAFMLDANNRIVGDEWFVFYGQPASPDNSVVHSGDCVDGAKTGDDEIIEINLQTVNPNVQKIAFVVTINEALEQGLNFSMVSNAYVRIVDAMTNAEINRFNLTDYYANVTSMVVGEVYRYNGQWKFNAVGDGVAKDLRGLCEMYGVVVND